MTQVPSSHYAFRSYLQKPRWNSVWHQLDEVLAFHPTSVLEVGPGPGILKATASSLGTRVETIDIDPELHPDHVGSVQELPFADQTFDVVCAFQILEHLPYNESVKAFQEMARVAAKGLLFSVPDVTSFFVGMLHLPRIGRRSVFLTIPSNSGKKNKFNGEHYWEIGWHGFPLRRILRDFSVPQWLLMHTFRVPEKPNHRFFSYSRISSSNI